MGEAVKDADYYTPPPDGALHTSTRTATELDIGPVGEVQVDAARAAAERDRKVC